MPNFYSRPFLHMCASILEIAKKYPEKNVLRLKQIDQMVDVVNQAKKQLAKFTPGTPQYKEAEEIAHQQVEAILTYVLESIKQEREGLKLDPKKDALYEMIEQALGIDETSQQANDCNAFLMGELPTDAKIAKLPPKSFLCYQVRFPFDEKDNDAKEYDMITATVWQVRYYDEAKRAHPVAVESVPGLAEALKKLNKKSTFTETEQKAVKNTLLPYHIKTNVNTLDDQTKFTNLIRLRMDVGRKRLAIKDMHQTDLFAHIDKLATKLFTQNLKKLNEEIVCRRPTYAALLKAMTVVERAKGTDKSLSGNQAQLVAFMRKAHMRLDRDVKHTLEDNRTANTPLVLQPGYMERYGLLLYCIILYEKDYWLKWDMFEKVKLAANIPSSSAIPNSVKSFYLSALDTYVSGILADKKAIAEFGGENGLTDPKGFLTEMQKRISKFREPIKEAAALGVSSTKAYERMNTMADWTADGSVYAGIYAMLNYLSAHPTVIISRPEITAALATILMVSRLRKLIAGGVTYYLSPAISDRIKKYLATVYSGAEGIFSDGLPSPTERADYLTACSLAPHTVVPHTFKKAIDNIACCPAEIPGMLAPAPDIKPVAAAAIEEELPSEESRGWNLFKKFA